MTTARFESSASTTKVVVSIPEGRIVTGRVKEVTNPDGTSLGFAGDVHPFKHHVWREMLHFGHPGTGFVQCICGAVGVPFDRRLHR